MRSRLIFAGQVALVATCALMVGVKVAVVDATGKLVDTATVYPFEPRRDRESSIAAIAALAKKHAVELIAIGNGTAGDTVRASVAAGRPNTTVTNSRKRKNDFMAPAISPDSVTPTW